MREARKVREGRLAMGDANEEEPNNVKLRPAPNIKTQDLISIKIQAGHRNVSPSGV